MHFESPAQYRSQMYEIINACEEKLSQLTGQKIDLAISSQSTISESDIKEVVCNEYAVSWMDIISDDRDRLTAFARHAYVMLCFRFTFLKIDDIMHNVRRHRSTFYSNLGRIEGLIFTKDAIFYPPYKRCNDFLNKKKYEYQINQSTSAGTAPGTERSIGM